MDAEANRIMYGVSIHAPTGGATSITGYLKRRLEFQFTRPRGARPWPKPVPPGRRSFNSRAHGGRDSETSSRRGSRRTFQFTRPRGARPGPAIISSSPGNGFNSRAHGGRDFCVPRQGGVPRSFNSRAHGGRDLSSATPGNLPRCFNSRAHGGRDAPRRLHGRPHRRVSIHAPTGGATAEAQDKLAALLVSIHAPTGGATRRDVRQVGRRGFNSRAHGGRDQSPKWRAKEREAFQFTRPRGARHANVFGGFRTHGFNSRAHGGRDQCRGAPHPSAAVSIHAPTGGATTRSRPWAWPARFQFTRPRGARPVGRIEVGRTRRVSIHAPTGGATGRAPRGGKRGRVSIHAPTGGATLGSVVT